jgi:hypothetical protein
VIRTTRYKPVSVVLDFLAAVHFEPTLLADRDGPLWSQFSQSRETMRMMLVRLRWPLRRRSCTVMMPGRPSLPRPERVLHRGPVHARPGRDGVNV